MSTAVPALDRTKEFPRSPRETLAGYIHAARMTDKCRAVLAGTNGAYHYNCPLDRYFFDFTGIDAEAFKTFVATGADDSAVADWITAHSKVKDRGAVVAWNNKMRDMRLSERPLPLQEFLEGYIRDSSRRTGRCACGSTFIISKKAGSNRRVAPL